MIEFLLLFGAGFLSAALLAALVAPAISRRVVAYTENRLIATMPISPQEVRAQKDMARASYAAENARAREELASAREQVVQLQTRETSVSGEATRLSGENHDLKAVIEEMTVEAGNLRSELRRAESRFLDMKERLGQVEKRIDETASENAALRHRANQLSIDADNLRVDIATRDAEAESHRIRINSLRAERDEVSRQFNEAIAGKLNSDNLLSGEVRKMARLEEKLAREKAATADREAALERRVREVARLRERIEEMRARGREEADTGPTIVRNPKKSTTRQTDMETGERNLRNQAAALTSRLENASGTANDEAFRQEIAAIAAGMVVLTAGKEGETSPLPAMLENAPSSGSKRKSIAVRAKNMLDKNSRSNGSL